ncbi:RDD family protein [Siminovitchia sediminis]|uniref:RDD family protein n=1 Tax=Siminovitchia sediminis TaxID=1274353 RepID=A0ABW4KJD4_9BACI
MDKDQIGIKTPEYVSIQFQLAGLGSRIAAQLLDQLILTSFNLVVIIILFVLLGRDASFSGLENEVNSIILGAAIIIVFIANWGYFVFMEYFFGGKTIGKRVLGIRVIQENGHSLTLLSSFIRNFLRIIDQLPASYLLGMLMIFFHSKHKRIGDLAAGTIVVHERKAKSNRKLSLIEKEIHKRGISKNDLPVEPLTLRSIRAQDWDLIRTYSSRLWQLPASEREEITRKVAEVVFPKFGWETTGKSMAELEGTLLALYVKLRDEWEYES